MRRIGGPKNLRLPDVTFNKAEFGKTLDYGKKSTLLNQESPPVESKMGAVALGNGE
jgi:hypothetical protein